MNGNNLWNRNEWEWLFVLTECVTWTNVENPFRKWRWCCSLANRWKKERKNTLLIYKYFMRAKRRRWLMAISKNVFRFLLFGRRANMSKSFMSRTIYIASMVSRFVVVAIDSKSNWEEGMNWVRVWKQVSLRQSELQSIASPYSSRIYLTCCSPCSKRLFVSQFSFVYSNFKISFPKRKERKNADEQGKKGRNGQKTQSFSGRTLDVVSSSTHNQSSNK